MTIMILMRVIRTRLSTGPVIPMIISSLTIVSLILFCHHVRPLVFIHTFHVFSMVCVYNAVLGILVKNFTRVFRYILLRSEILRVFQFPLWRYSFKPFIFLFRLATLYNRSLFRFIKHCRPLFLRRGFSFRCFFL